MAGKWSRLFPAGDFRWSIGMRPGDARAFFAPTAEHARIMEERDHWLREMPAECAMLTEDGVALLQEAADLASEWSSAQTQKIRDDDSSIGVDTLQRLGRMWEPDFVLLSVHEDRLTVEGGVVCFPSSWALREKLGRTLEFTHSVVPDLNAQLGPRIQKILAQLATGAAWERENWGLSADGERNHFVHRPRSSLGPDTTPEQVWLRIERQVLFKLPKTGGILFGIRLEILPWVELVADPYAREGLERVLASMSEEAAQYKGLAATRGTMLRWLRDR